MLQRPSVKLHLRRTQIRQVLLTDHTVLPDPRYTGWAHDGHAECCLNWNVYGIGVNCEFEIKCMQKMNVIAKISWYLECSVVTLKLRKEYLNTVTYNTSVLLGIKQLNCLIYRTLFYVNICVSYKLSKNSPVFWSTLYISANEKNHINSCLPKCSQTDLLTPER